MYSLTTKPRVRQITLTSQSCGQFTYFPPVAIIKQL